MKKLAISGALIISLSSFASIEASAAENSTYMEVQSTIMAAEAAIKMAAKGHGEWRDSKKFLKRAQAAADKGDLETAMKLAKKAKFEGEMGLAQAEDQAGVKPWAF